MAADGVPTTPRQPVAAVPDASVPDIFAGHGEMRTRCRALDWSATPLGPVEGWPISLRTTAAIVLAAPIGMILLWGPELVQIYNDRYREVMGDKHPGGLGQRNIECWPEVWDFTGPIYEGVLERGESFTFTDQPLTLKRRGTPDEGFFTLSYTPVPGDDGQVGGILVTVLETTAQVRARSERESQLLLANELLQEQAAELEVQTEELQTIAEQLEERTVAAEESEGALRVTEARLRFAMEIAELGAWDLDLVGGGSWRALRYDQIFGYENGRSEWTYQDFLAHVHPDDRAAVDARFGSALASHGAWDFTCRIRRAGDGAERWIAARGDVVCDAVGRPERMVGVVRDVTEQQHAERALQASEARFRLMADAIPQIVWLTDAEGRTEFFNAQWTRYTGAAYEPRTTASVAGSFVHPDDVAATVDAFERARREGKAFSVEHRIRSASGEYRWFLVRAEPYRNPGTGTIERWFGASTDIHDRRIAEAARTTLLAEVAAERERLRALILSMPAPVALLDGPEHRFMLVNDAFKRISGGGRDVTGLTPLEAFPELGDSAMQQLLSRVYRSGEPWIGRETLVRFDRDGHGVQDTWFDLRLQPLHDARGRVESILNFAVDVTDQVLARREVERLLRESEEVRLRHEALLASIGDAFYLLDREWRFTYVNDAAEPLLQTTRDRLIGRTLWDAFPGVAGSVFEGPYRESMATGKHTSVEAYFEPLDTWFDVHTYAWSGGLMVHFRDIGARVRAAAERERLLEAAEAARAEAVSANRAKSEFLAVMSHELRTPLNAIDGYAELMELGIRGPLTGEQRQDLARIRKSQKSLLGLINGVLNYARVEAGAVHYDMESVVVEDVLATCEALTLPQVHAKGLMLIREPASPSLLVHADREKLQQVVLNLLSNAIKFTPTGGAITVRCVPAEVDGVPVVRIMVSDTGIGIAPNQLARVFEPFVQVDSELTRTRDGTGLGLAISRDLARGMDGELTAESVLGHGSTFILTLRAG